MVAAAVACAAAALATLAAGRFRWARAAAIGQVALILIGWGLAQSPHLVVPDLTVTGARTAGPTLTWLLWPWRPAPCSCSRRSPISTGSSSGRRAGPALPTTGVPCYTEAP